MSERTCKGCGATFRKGLRRMLFGAPGMLESVIVCVSCADRALCIVALIIAPVEVKRYVADPQLERMLRALESYRSAAQHQVETTHDGFWQGRIDGLDTAIATVRAAKEGRLV